MGRTGSIRDPLTDHVRFFKIFLRCSRYGFGRSQPGALPFKTALDGPGHDALALSQERLEQTLVALRLRDCHNKGNEMQSPPHCLVYRPYCGLVVANDDQLEPRRELEKILAHESRSNPIAAGHQLELAFGPTASLLSLGDADHPCAPQTSDIGWMPLACAAMKVSSGAVVA